MGEHRLVEQTESAVASLKADYQHIMKDAAVLRDLLGQLQTAGNPADVMQRIFEITHNVKG